ncbi:T9SS type A sorting domain-containing protein [Chryseolinea soli]|uniref:T9SS C-terminal target domain-containing protein n=1 Tax=Chryseolinea soli TaxID=2321403 RepID=A0A385T1X7_9BACT|nr:T9SS type A sorting domain-containing protein [Chryseolinea soli]AYB35138.1 T9SS C-terminal target domain-containing protein [Chryseolinea soli]
MKNPRLTAWIILLLALCVSTHAAGQFSYVTLPSGLQPTESEMVVFQDNMYLVLQDWMHTSFSLHKFNGGGATPIPVPSPYRLYPDTQFEEMNGALYFMPDHDPADPTAAELMRYDGTTLTPIDIPDALIPADSMVLYGHRPFVFENALYIEAVRTTANPPLWDYYTITYWIKYDGTSFSRINVSRSALTCEWPFEHSVPSDKLIYQDKLVARYQDYHSGARSLLSYDGITIDRNEAIFHSGALANPGGCEMEIYQGNLYLPTFDLHAPGSPFGGKLSRYDGITETEVAMPAGLRYAETTLEVYADKLWGAMYDGTGAARWYAYDGTTFTNVPLPPGTSINSRADQRFFRCQLYIVLQIGTADDTIPKYALYGYSELRGCGSSVLPPAFDRFDRIDIRNYGHEREWCWTGIDVDWTIFPPCKFPDCIDPVFAVSLLDKPGAVVWTKSYQQPFQAIFPVDDKQPYITTVAMENDKKLQDVVVFDKELVPGGIESIKMEMKPRQKEFYLTVETEKNKKVPFIMALLDAAGKTLWQQEFTAPLSTSIDAVTKQRGTTLRFLPAQGTNGITAVSVFPNPSESSPAIDIRTQGNTLPAKLTITNFYGKTVYQKDITAPTVHYPNLSQATPGLYIVTVTSAGGYEHKEVLVIK